MLPWEEIVDDFLESVEPVAIPLLDAMNRALEYLIDEERP